MIPREMLKHIQNAPIADRLQVIEVILQSLKLDIEPTLRRDAAKKKTFKVRRFHLGQEVHCDRDEIYAERG